MSKKHRNGSSITRLKKKTFFFFFFFKGGGELVFDHQASIFLQWAYGVMICLGQGGLRSLSASSDCVMCVARFAKYKGFTVFHHV